MKIYVQGEKDISPIATPIYGFAVITKDISGLDYDIWLDPAGKSRNTSHSNSPRLKVVVGRERIPYSISNTPKMLVKNRASIEHEAEVLRWIAQNSNALLQHYNLQINDKDILNRVERLK